MTQLAPGWYADPSGLRPYRWWDGYRWSEQTAPPAATPEPAIVAVEEGRTEDPLPWEESTTRPKPPAASATAVEPGRHAPAPPPDDVKPGPESKVLVDGLRSVLADIEALQATPEQRKAEVLTHFHAVRADLVQAQLATISVERLKDATEGRLRLGQLQLAGYRTVVDVLRAGPSRLQLIPGVGPQTATQAFAAARHLAATVEETIPIRLDADRRPRAHGQLIAALRAYEDVDRVLAPLRDDLASLSRRAQPLLEDKAAQTGRLRWMFLGAARKDQFRQHLRQVDALARDPQVLDVVEGLRSGLPMLSKPDLDAAALWADYEARAPDYYGLLGELADLSLDVAAVHGHIPAELAERISKQQLDQSQLTVSLRGYQSFGAQVRAGTAPLHRRRRDGVGQDGRGDRRHGPSGCAWVHALPRRLPGQRACQLDARGSRAVSADGAPCARRRPAALVQDVAVQRRRRRHHLRDASQPAAAGSLAGAGRGGRGALHQEPVGRPVQGHSRLDGPRRPRPVPDWHGDGEPRRGVQEPGRLPEARGRCVDSQRQWHRGCRLLPRRRCARLPAAEPGGRPLGAAERLDMHDWVDLSRPDMDAYRDAVASRNFMAMRRASFVAGPQAAKVQRLLEIVDESASNGWKVVVFSFFYDVLLSVQQALDGAGHGPLTGSVAPAARQELIDRFGSSPGHAVLLSQIQAGGTGLNMQAASVVVLTEPQWKPSLEEQAIARCHRMGQVRRVHVHRLLAQDAVDQRMLEILQTKRALFDEYVRRSALKDVSADAVDIADSEATKLAVKRAEQDIIERERQRLGLAS